MNIISGNKEFTQAIREIWGEEEPSLSLKDIRAICEKNKDRWTEDPYDCIGDTMGRVTRLSKSQWIPNIAHIGVWLFAQKYEQNFEAMEQLPQWLGRGQITFAYIKVNDIPILYGDTSTVPDKTIVDYSFGLHSDYHETVYGVYGELDAKELYEFLVKVRNEHKKTNWYMYAGTPRQCFVDALDLVRN